MYTRIFVICFVCGLFIFGGMGIIYLSIQQSKTGKKFHTSGDKNVEYFRDVPCKWNVDLCYFVAVSCGNIYPSFQMNFISAKALEFYRKGKISINKGETGEYYIDMSNISKFDSEVDKKIYNILLAAASSDRHLTSNELTAYVDINYASIINTFDEIKVVLDEQFKISGLDMVEESRRIFGLKKFIKDFSMIPELDHEHVYLRDTYMEFAILFGVADKIDNEFKDIYPFTYYNPLIKPSKSKPVYGNNMYEDKLLQRRPELRNLQNDDIDFFNSKKF